MNPKLAAIISVLPGLGHLYNGETGKGLLFLAVGTVNLFIMGILIFHEPFVATLAAAGKIFGLILNEKNAAALGLSKPAFSSLFLYALILIGFTIFAVKDAYHQAQERLKGKQFARYYLGLAEASSGAYIVHFLLLACFILVSIYSTAPKPPREEIAEIELTQPEPPPPELPPPPPPSPRKEPAKSPEKKVIPQPEPLQKPPVAKSTEPPKQAPTPVAIATPTDAPSNLTTAPVDGAPSDTNGGATTSGTAGTGTGDAGGAGDGTDVDYGSYIAEMQKRIKKAWFPPKGNESKTITVKFKIKKGGDLGRVKLLVSSGMAMADEAAIEAVKNAAPFPPLPSGSPDEIEIKFTFDYSVFNGGKAFLK